MDKRFEIGIFYRYTPGWMGGVYYIQNLISALTTLSETDQPFVHIYTDGEEKYDELVNITKYGKLLYHYYDFKGGLIQRMLLGFQKLLSPIYYFPTFPINLKKSNVAFVYPTIYDNVTPTNKVLGWIPDMQEKYLPELFSVKSIKNRETGYKRFIKHNIPIVFSSNDAVNDFNKFYPNHGLKTYVLHFATSHPSIDKIRIQDLFTKYNINGDYLFCANQFWVHKNHLFLFKAFLKARERGLSMKLVCTGLINDKRDPEYAKRLVDFIKVNNLQDSIIFTGFIDRAEQICLMKNCYAVIQPSLFEGWSTVVEDAKALNKFIFLSSINVHMEQNPANVEYFDPYNHMDLVEKLLNVKPTYNKINYNNNVRQFALDFIRIAKDQFASL